LLNGEDEDVPVMDDFNREKRFFTISDLKEFMKKSLNNYYTMNDSPDEFENYETNTNSASLWRISMNPAD
jgi:hypothetical protein